MHTTWHQSFSATGRRTAFTLTALQPEPAGLMAASDLANEPPLSCGRKV